MFLFSSLVQEGPQERPSEVHSLTGTGASAVQGPTQYYEICGGPVQQGPSPRCQVKAPVCYQWRIEEGARNQS